MRIFQEEIFGPVVSITTFKTTEEAIAIANDTLYGLGAGVWTRDAMKYTRCQGQYRLEEFGSIANTRTRRTHHSGAIKNLALAGKTTK